MISEKTSSSSNYPWLKGLSFCGLAFGLSYISYKFCFPYFKSLFVSEKQNPMKRQQIYTHYSQIYFDKHMEVKIVEDCLAENPSIEDIYLHSPTICRDEFIKYTKQIRKRRRLIRKYNEEQYIELILTYENQIQELLNRSRLELIDFLNVNPDEFAKMEQNYDVVEDLHALHKKAQRILRSQLFLHTPVKKMSKQKLTVIMNEEIAFVKTKMYERIKNKLQMETTPTHQQILAVVKALQEDIIFESYGYEREDVQRQINSSLIDIKERDRCTAMLEADVVAFNYESLDSLEGESIDPDEEFRKTLPTLGLSIKSTDKSDNKGQ